MDKLLLDHQVTATLTKPKLPLQLVVYFIIININVFVFIFAGSGKSTYCKKMADFLKKLDRKVSIVNLDPANENMPYEASIDVMDLIKVEEAMQQFGLGPNGALMYCIETLEKNFDWLVCQIEKQDSNYFIFDCPGQVELYTHHCSVRNMLQILEGNSMRLCVVHLIDSHFCSDPHKYISALLLSLNTMLQIGLPHVNLLSKADQFQQFKSKLLFNLEFYTDVLNLKYLLDALDDCEMQKYKKLNHAIVSMIDDYSLVSFHALDASRTESLIRVKNVIDKANGYAFSTAEETSINTLLATAMGAQPETERIQHEVEPYF